MKPILVIDSNYVAHRVMFKMGNLSYQEKMTGVIFGFLRTIMELHERFKPADIVFCWDSPKSWRKVIFPDYKGNRNKDLSPTERRDRETAYSQFNELRDDILPRIGFANVFTQTGIEADDIIAKVVIEQPLGELFYRKHIIVSSDNDLFQVLALADMYFIDKKQLFTKKDFIEQYDVHPSDWLKVKSLVGDSSDNIPGVKGVGIKTAVKYLNGNRTMKLTQLIQENADQINLNEILMRIPHSRTESVEVKQSKINMFQFEQVCMENGFNFFMKKEQYFKWEKMFQ